jgi:chromate transporter
MRVAETGADGNGAATGAAGAEALPAAGNPERGSALEVLGASTRLGLTSFGGPVAHLGFFRQEYVERRRWLDAATYADLVALCQFLPGPASSPVGIGIGIMRAGLWGGLAAWLGFTLPSALALIAFAYGVTAFDLSGAGWLHGLKIVAVAVVAQAVWGMSRQLAPDRPRATIALLAAIVALLWPAALVQVAIIVVAGLLGWRLLRSATVAPVAQGALPVRRGVAIGCWVAFFALLGALPLLRQLSSSHALAVFDSFYRSGSLVFGGGHVVLPLLQAEVVPPGWVTNDQFIAGYGAAQAVPGPLFTFAAYLGAVSAPTPNGLLGGLLALVAIFLPSFLLVTGALPFWHAIRARPAFQRSLAGVNAAVVGLLLAALYTPVWTSAIGSVTDVALLLAVAGLLLVWKLPPWLVVILGAVAGQAVGMLGR